MSRQVVDLEEELTRIWTLVSDLTEQLANNRALVQQLKDRSDNVKGQAAHVGTGFPLRRFNLDISDEVYQGELEAFASHLVLENQQLQHENKQLNALLREYEGTLETVMGKFRGVAHSSQQHDLSLHAYYSSLLQTLQTAHSSSHLHDDTSLSLLLNRLSTLLRSALRALGGEEPDVDLAALIKSSVTNGRSNSDGSSGPPSPTKSVSSGKKSVSSGAKSVIKVPPPRAPTFPGFLPGSSGGYAGTEGHGDWALEREMEILRLEEENKQLRDLLVISEELPAVPAAVLEEAEEAEDKETPSPSLEAQGRRKSSLTVEELEAGATQEADEKQRAIAAGEIDEEGRPLVDGKPVPPGTGLGGGAGLSLGNRPMLSESVLGFAPETAPPEEAIDDGPEA